LADAELTNQIRSGSWTGREAPKKAPAQLLDIQGTGH
jgi:hypothetical protein